MKGVGEKIYMCTDEVFAITSIVDLLQNSYQAFKRVRPSLAALHAGWKPEF